MKTKSGNLCVAVIPVREGSQRVKNKNFRPFVCGKSLLELKIEQIKKESCFDKIYISSDSEKAKNIAKTCDVEFLYRTPHMCSSEVRWADAIYAVVQSIPEKNPIVSWVHTTSPFHTQYAKPLKIFKELYGNHDSLVIVAEFQEFILNEKGRPINYHWGVWHDYSQDLEKLYKVTGALFIAKKQDMLRWKYVIGIKPYLYTVDRISSVEIDNIEDFEQAQLLSKIEGKK